MIDNTSGGTTPPKPTTPVSPRATERRADASALGTDDTTTLSGIASASGPKPKSTPMGGHTGPSAINSYGAKQNPDAAVPLYGTIKINDQDMADLKAYNAKNGGQAATGTQNPNAATPLYGYSMINDKDMADLAAYNASQAPKKQNPDAAVPLYGNIMINDKDMADLAAYNASIKKPKPPVVTGGTTVDDGTTTVSAGGGGNGRPNGKPQEVAKGAATAVAAAASGIVVNINHGASNAHGPAWNKPKPKYTEAQLALQDATAGMSTTERNAYIEKLLNDKNAEGANLNNLGLTQADWTYLEGVKAANKVVGEISGAGTSGAGGPGVNTGTGPTISTLPGAPAVTPTTKPAFDKPPTKPTGIAYNGTTIAPNSNLAGGATGTIAVPVKANDANGSVGVATVARTAAANNTIADATSGNVLYQGSKLNEATISSGTPAEQAAYKEAHQASVSGAPMTEAQKSIIVNHMAQANGGTALTKAQWAELAKLETANNAAAGIPMTDRAKEAIKAQVAATKKDPEAPKTVAQYVAEAPKVSGGGGGGGAESALVVSPPKPKDDGGGGGGGKKKKRD
jgi:cytochrome c553